MKKSLLALAVLGAVAGAAQAQSSITVYGVLDMAVQSENNGGAAGAKTGLDSGIQSGSRLGFKGTEDLGGGLKANFKLEMGVNADEGASAQGKKTFGRNATVGLSGDFGAVNMGRQNIPLFNAVDSIDPFSTGVVSAHAGEGTSGYGAAAFFLPGTWDPRSNNTINYSTNDISGFAGTVAYTFGEVAGDIGNTRQLGASASYNAGPISAVAAYHVANNVKDSAGVDLGQFKTAYAGATYDFGMVKAAAAYANMTGKKAWMLGATVPVSAADAVIASFTRVTDKTAATDNHGNQFALGFTHSMSKRTNLYTSFSRTANDANSNAGGLAAGNGLTDRLFNVGVRHMF
ncbi:MAG: porin [Burkholderiales bacterium]|nr:porin [Burkholderiales bacterium]